MVDTFLLLTLARTGDQLQGIKKGVLELADVIAVNKADGPHERDARAAARELAGALRLLHRASDPEGWRTPVLTCSALHDTGLDELWERLTRHQHLLHGTGALTAKRREQQVRWTWAVVHDHLIDRLHHDPAVTGLAPALEDQVRDGTLTPTLAAHRILDAFATGG
jgi:LAO/AO transport system kinase